MTEKERASEIRQQLLAAAPLIWRNHTYLNDNDIALLTAENYYKNSTIITDSQSDLICEYWQNGRDSEFIAMLMDISRVDVHKVLVERGYHAPYLSHTIYSVREVNEALNHSLPSKAVSNAIYRTYASPQDQRLFDVKRPMAPSKKEIEVCRRLLRERNHVNIIASMAGRTVPEISSMLDIGM